MSMYYKSNVNVTTRARNCSGTVAGFESSSRSLPLRLRPPLLLALLLAVRETYLETVLASGLGFPRRPEM